MRLLSGGLLLDGWHHCGVRCLVMTFTMKSGNAVLTNPGHLKSMNDFGASGATKTCDCISDNTPITGRVETGPLPKTVPAPVD